MQVTGKLVCLYVNILNNLLKNMGLSQNKRILLQKFVSNKCEMCHKKNYKLQAHRINRGYQEGEYIMRNIMMICEECHKRLHFKEF